MTHTRSCKFEQVLEVFAFQSCSSDPNMLDAKVFQDLDQITCHYCMFFHADKRQVPRVWQVPSDLQSLHKGLWIAYCNLEGLADHSCQPFFLMIIEIIVGTLELPSQTQEGQHTYLDPETERIKVVLLLDGVLSTYVGLLKPHRFFNNLLCSLLRQNFSLSAV